MPMSVAFGKNIDITSICTCVEAIDVLSKFNDSASFNISFLRYKEKTSSEAKP